MAELSSMDAVYIALVFIVPGYVFSALRGQLVAGRRSTGPDYYVSLLTVSAVNFALIGWTIYLAIAWDAPAIVRAALWTFVVLMFPAILGVVCGFCTQRDVVRRIYARLKLRPLHVVPTAWDYKFSSSPGEWVLVTLKDDTRYAGWWGQASFSSTEPSERDMLIEHVWQLNDDQPWTPTNKSLLIAGGEIRTIEFTLPEKEDPNGQDADPERPLKHSASPE